MKCRLNQPALPKMKLALRGEQPVTQHHSSSLKHTALGELTLTSYENIFHHLRIVYEECLDPAQLELNEVAVLPSQATEETNWTAAEFDCVSQDELRLGAGNGGLHAI